MLYVWVVPPPSFRIASIQTSIMQPIATVIDARLSDSENPERDQKLASDWRGGEVAKCAVLNAFPLSDTSVFGPSVESQFKEHVERL